MSSNPPFDMTMTRSPASRLLRDRAHDVGDVGNVARIDPLGLQVRDQYFVDSRSPSGSVDRKTAGRMTRSARASAFAKSD